MVKIPSIPVKYGNSKEKVISFFKIWLRNTNQLYNVDRNTIILNKNKGVLYYGKPDDEIK